MFSIYLPQRGSLESKPVGSPHDDTAASANAIHQELPALLRTPLTPDGFVARYRCSIATELNNLPFPAALLFDLDGTLIDSVATRIAAWLDALEQAGLPTTHERLAPLIGLDGTRLAREIAAIAGRPIDDGRAEEIDRCAGARYEELNRTPLPLPGVQRLIELLEDRDITWAIATSSRKEQVAASVGALGLSREPRIVDADHVKNAKPEPDLLLLAAKQIGTEPSRCWYVGDSTWDMVSAVAARMIAVGVTAGAAVDSTALKGAGAAAVVDDLDDLADALAKN